jgi:hypothetical protein
MARILRRRGLNHEVATRRGMGGRVGRRRMGRGVGRRGVVSAIFF